MNNRSLALFINFSKTLDQSIFPKNLLDCVDKKYLKHRPAPVYRNHTPIVCSFKNDTMMAEHSCHISRHPTLNRYIDSAFIESYSRDVSNGDDTMLLCRMWFKYVKPERKFLAVVITEKCNTIADITTRDYYNMITKSRLCPSFKYPDDFIKKVYATQPFVVPVANDFYV